MGDDRDSLARQERNAQAKRDEKAAYMKERQQRLSPDDVNDETTGDVDE